MKSRTMKRLFSVLLVLCLTAGTLCVPIRAAEDGQTETTASVYPEALENPDASESQEGDAEAPESPGAPERDVSPSRQVHPGVGSVEDSIPFSRLPSPNDLEPGLSYSGRYRDQLDSASRAVYDAICRSPLMDGPTMEEVSLNVVYSSSAEPHEPILAALGALLYDHPELSWLVNTEFEYGTRYPNILDTFAMSEDGYRAATTDPGETVDSSTRGLADTKDLSAIQAALAAARAEIGDLSGLSEYNRVKTLHDWICNHMDYTDQSGSKFRYGWRGFQTVYSALVERETVCAGYAKSFKLLCQEYGVPCAIVVGLGNGGAHAWNYVELGGAWYAVDCTWADQNGYISYNYFLKGSIDFARHEEGTLYGEYAFAYPELSRESYRDPTAPASIRLSYSPESTSSNPDLPSFSIPAAEAPGVQAEKRVVLTAVPLNAGGEALSGRQVDWSMDRAREGVTLTPDGNTAVLSFTSSALRTYNNGSGPVITVTASCGSTKAQQEFLIYVPTRTPAFLQILRDGTVLDGSDQIAPESSAAYTAGIYDQYGMELAGQTVSWEVSGPVRIVQSGGGAVLSPSASAGTAVLTAKAGSLSAELAITIAAAAHSHVWTEDWTWDENFHWHECAAPGCSVTEANSKDGYAPHSYDGPYRSDANGHWRACVCGAESAAVSHLWDAGAVTEPPSFDAPGLQTFTCAVCGYARTEELPPLEHTYREEWSRDENGHWHACADPGYERLEQDRADHAWDAGAVTEPPSFDAPGLRTFTCAVCGYARTEELPPLEHTYREEWSWDENGHWHACADPGYERLEKDRGAHIYSGGMVCEICGRVSPAPAITVGASGAYQTVNAPADARLFLVRYDESRRFASVRELEQLTGRLSGSGRLLLLDQSLRPLCPSGELNG